MKSISIYNTLTSRKERFRPIKGGEAGLYVCGITPYGESHLGHARCYIVFDVLKRLLDFLGYKVKYIQNITDIDDKIINKSKESGKSPREIADTFTGSFMENMKRLNVKEADEYPRVSETVPSIIEFIKKLIEKSMAYQSGGSIYFRTSKFPSYGRLSGRKVEDLRSGAPNSEKEAPEDFALWKKDPEFGWESPWGRGRPGWHIECSVMSEKSLGRKFDIHGGGLDLIFPHHENEIAQSAALTGEVPANYWMHNGMVTLKGDKMAKSTGNFFMLSSILKEYDPMALRLYLLGAGYRQSLDFSPRLLKESEKALARLKEFKKELLARAPEESFHIDQEGKNSALEALRDDLNTPGAIGEIFKKISPLLDKFYSGTHNGADIKEGIGYLKLLEEVLGIRVNMEETFNSKEIESMLKEREDLRKKGDYRGADAIRDSLAEKGIEIKDTPTGPRWSYSN